MIIKSLVNMINTTTPYAWDDSLTLYEFLGKIVSKLNELVDEVNLKLPDDFEIAFYKKFREYTREEMQKILESGEFADILDSMIVEFSPIKEEVIEARDGKDSLGAKIRNIDVQLADITPVNIKNFGAKDVMTNPGFDSTQAIQDAINYARGENGNGMVYVPPGVYNISDEIIIPGTIYIKGSTEQGFTATRANGSTIVQTVANKSIFKFTGNSWGTEISKLFLRGQKHGIEIIDGITFSEFVFEKIHFNGSFESCIRLRGSIGKISDCDFSSGGDHKYGIDMVYVTSVWIEHNNFWNCSDAHIKIRTATDIHVSNNWFEYTNKTCILFEAPVNSYRVVFSNNDFHSGQGTCVELNAVTKPTEIFNIKETKFQDCRFNSQKNTDELIRVRLSGATNPGNSYDMSIHDSIFSNIKVSAITSDIRLYQLRLINVLCFHEWNYSYAPTMTGINGVIPAVREYKTRENLELNGGIRFFPKLDEGWVDNMLYVSNTTGKLTFRENSSSEDTRRVIMGSNQTMAYNSASDNASLKANIDAIRQILKDVNLIN